MSREEINQKLALLPDLPGCYIMRDKDDEIIYIGKAKNLKNRVKSYFHSKHEGKTQLLVADIDRFETIVTKTNKESLLLEINLRPSGGICYSHACGVSLPVLFAKRQTGQLTKGHAKNSAVRSFRRATVRVVSDVIHLPE